MGVQKIGLVLVIGFVFAAGAVATAHAAEPSSTSLVHFNQPVAIPGKVLSAGSYLFEASGPLLQIWSADRSSVYATLLTIPAYRTSIDGRSFDLEQQGGESSLQAAEIKSWFPEGDYSGQELIYPEQTPEEGSPVNPVN